MRQESREPKWCKSSKVRLCGFFFCFVRFHGDRDGHCQNTEHSTRLGHGQRFVPRSVQTTIKSSRRRSNRSAPSSWWTGRPRVSSAESITSFHGGARGGHGRNDAGSAPDQQLNRQSRGLFEPRSCLSEVSRAVCRKRRRTQAPKRACVRGMDVGRCTSVVPTLIPLVAFMLCSISLGMCTFTDRDRWLKSL